jgi:hypothetical protein
VIPTNKEGKLRERGEHYDLAKDFLDASDWEEL